MDTLRDLSLHGPQNPTKFHLPSVEEFSSYVGWLGVQD